MSTNGKAILYDYKRLTRSGVDVNNNIAKWKHNLKYKSKYFKEQKITQNLVRSDATRFNLWKEDDEQILTQFWVS